MAASDARATVGEPEVRQDDAETSKLQQLRAMEQPSWNEARLNDLNKKVDEGFSRMDGEFRAVRIEMKEGFEKVDRRFEKVNEEFTAVRREMKSGFDRLQWTLISAAAAIIAALIAAPHL